MIDSGLIGCCEVPRGEKTLYSETDPESCTTEYTSAYKDETSASPSREEHLTRVWGLAPESQGRNLALTVLDMPRPESSLASLEYILTVLNMSRLSYMLEHTRRTANVAIPIRRPAPLREWVLGVYTPRRTGHHLATTGTALIRNSPPPRTAIGP